MLCSLVLALHIVFQEHSYMLIRDLSCPAWLLISCSRAPTPYKHTQVLAVALALRSTQFLTALTKNPITQPCSEQLEEELSFLPAPLESHTFPAASSSAAAAAPFLARKPMFLLTF